MTRNHVAYAVAVYVTATAYTPPIAAADEATDTPNRRRKPPLEVVMRIAEERESWHVGDTVQVSVALKNVSDRDIRVRGVQEPGAWDIELWYDEFPGVVRGQLIRREWRGYAGGYSPRVAERSVLGPGDTSGTAQREFTLLLPGDAHIVALFSAGHTAYRGTTASLSHTYPGGFTGLSTLVVAQDMAAPMAERYDEARRHITASGASVDDAITTLNEIADEGHYFAAAFVREVFNETKAEPVKHVAFQRLVDLLETGIAYEALPDLLAALPDESLPRNARIRLLKRLSRFRLTGEHPGVSVAGIGYYGIPDEIRRSAIETLEQTARSDDDELASLAAVALESPNPRGR